MAHDHAAARPILDSSAFVNHLRVEAALFANAVRRGPLDAAVTACPGWDLQRLVEHLTSVHIWARTAAATGEKVMFADPTPPADSDFASWYLESANALIDVLDGLDPDAPTWHIFPTERVNRVWPRRQLHETMIHRWDAEQAVAVAGSAPSTTPLDPVFAADGIDEYFEILLPRLVKRAAGEGSPVALPTTSLHVHCLDTQGEWLVLVADGGLVMTREHAKGDAALRGRAEDILLQFWGRTVAEGAVDIVGDPAAAAQWLALGGL